MIMASEHLSISLSMQLILARIIKISKWEGHSKRTRVDPRRGQNILEGGKMCKSLFHVDGYGWAKEGRIITKTASESGKKWFQGTENWKEYLLSPVIVFFYMKNRWNGTTHYKYKSLILFCTTTQILLAKLL